MASTSVIKMQVSPSLSIWVRCIERRILMGGDYPSEYEVDRAIEKWLTLTIGSA